MMVCEGQKIELVSYRKDTQTNPSVGATVAFELVQVNIALVYRFFGGESITRGHFLNGFLSLFPGLTLYI